MYVIKYNKFIRLEKKTFVRKLIGDLNVNEKEIKLPDEIFKESLKKGIFLAKDNERNKMEKSKSAQDKNETSLE